MRLRWGGRPRASPFATVDSGGLHPRVEEDHRPATQIGWSRSRGGTALCERHGEATQHSYGPRSWKIVGMATPAMRSDGLAGTRRAVPLGTAATLQAV